MKNIKWTTLFAQCYCLIKGFSIRKLQTNSEIKAAFDLKNKVNYDVYQLPPLPQTEGFVYPKGAAYILGAFKGERLIGSIQLLDLTQTAAYSSKVYPNHVDYNRQTTYEVKGFVIDQEFQKNAGVIFNFLVYYSIIFSNQTNRDKWIVVTNKVFYDKIKRRSGLATEFISDEYTYVEDESTQSQYFKNYVESGQINDLCCYYIEMPTSKAVSRLMARFIRIAAMKIVKKLKGDIFSSNPRKTIQLTK